MEQPKTLLEAIKHFSDYENCHQFMIAVRWSDGVVRCPRCGSADVSYMPNAKQYHCKAKAHKATKFSLKVGTIFEDSPIGLEKWLPAAWLISNCKNGISSYELARALGVTQKSAWHMLHRLREAMTDTVGKLGGSAPIEIDETFVGGKVQNMHKHKRAASQAKGGNKALVFGMLERGGRVKAHVIADRGRQQIEPAMAAGIEAGADIITDEFATYSMACDAYSREVITHAMQYVNGHVHTNRIENFWSLLKRGLKGTYISVEPFHLDAYVAEQVFRYNNRKDADDFARFATCIMGVQGKRLTYKALTQRPSVN